MILDAFFKALGQTSDPRFRRVLALGIGLSLALLIAVTSGFVWWIDWLTQDGVWIPIIGEVTWLGDLLSWGSLFVMGFLSIFLMIPVASMITSMFLDEVAQAVEDVHYPGSPPARRTTLSEAIRDTLAFLGLLIVANLGALILYLIFPFAALFIFWAVNGLLLGREYFTLAAMRRVGRDRAKELRRAYAGRLWLAGSLMAVPLSVPLLNLLIPILGAATFTHIFHMTSQQADLATR